MSHLKLFEQFLNETSKEKLLKKMNDLAKAKYGKEYLTVSHSKASKEIDGYKELYDQYKKVNENAGGNVEHYRYLDIEKVENGLKISLNDDGKQNVEDEGGIEERNFGDYFEDVMGNSDYLFIENLGDVGFGLTDAPGILYGYDYNDDGLLMDDGRSDSEVYWFPNYMVREFTQDMLEYGFVIFTKA
jgi:hypothetical protein